MELNNIIIAQPTTTEQVNNLIKFLEELNIDFKIAEEGNYNQEFVNKILESKKQANQGKLTRIKKDNIKKVLGL